MASERASLVVICSPDGSVVDVLQDERALLGAEALGKPLPLLVDSASSAKCERFLKQLQRCRGAFDWTLNLRTGSHARNLCFAGISQADDRLLIVADRMPAVLLRTLDERLARPACAQRGQVVSVPEAPDMLDELTRVNNDLVNVQRELARRNAQLAALTQQRNELLANAAHDLRNPILVVQGYCDLLRGETDPLTPSQRALVERVQEAAELMRNVLEDAMAYSRIETGKQLVNDGEAQLDELARACVESYRTIADSKQIELRFSCSGGLPLLHMSPTHAQQILGNLVSNAIKFSNPGGFVEVDVSEAGAHLVLAVSDHGQGIDPGELPQLFRPFQTTSTRPTAGELSTGLGLAIVRKLVERLGGKVTVDSILHHGTTFTVRLPVSPRGASC